MVLIIKKQYIGRYLDITNGEFMMCKNATKVYLPENRNVLLTIAVWIFYVFCHCIARDRKIGIKKCIFHFCWGFTIIRWWNILNDSKYIANCRAGRIIWLESWRTFKTFLGRQKEVWKDSDLVLKIFIQLQASLLVTRGSIRRV